MHGIMLSVAIGLVYFSYLCFLLFLSESNLVFGLSLDLNRLCMRFDSSYFLLAVASFILSLFFFVNHIGREMILCATLFRSHLYFFEVTHFTNPTHLTS